jgi:hypothetical protein
MKTTMRKAMALSEHRRRYGQAQQLPRAGPNSRRVSTEALCERTFDELPGDILQFHVFIGDRDETIRVDDLNTKELVCEWLWREFGGELTYDDFLTRLEIENPSFDTLEVRLARRKRGRPPAFVSIPWDDFVDLRRSVLDKHFNVAGIILDSLVLADNITVREFFADG